MFQGMSIAASAIMTPVPETNSADHLGFLNSSVDDQHSRQSSLCGDGAGGGGDMQLPVVNATHGGPSLPDLQNYQQDDEKLICFLLVTYVFNMNNVCRAAKDALSSEVALVEPILRFFQLLCENHNSLLQVSAKHIRF